MRTRKQKAELQEAGHVPSPPQQLPVTTRPRRTTRQSSRSASAEPTPNPTSLAPHTQDKAADRVVGSRVAKKSREPINKSNQKKPQKKPTQSSRSSTTSRLPTTFEQPIETEHATPYGYSTPFHDTPESVRHTEQTEGSHISLSSTSPLSSSSGSNGNLAPPQGNSLATNAQSQRQMSQTSQLFASIVESNSPKSQGRLLLSGSGNYRAPYAESQASTTPPSSPPRSGHILSPRSEADESSGGDPGAAASQSGAANEAVAPATLVENGPSREEEADNSAPSGHQLLAPGAGEPTNGEVKSAELFNWREGPPTFDYLGNEVPQVYLTTLLPLSVLREVSLFIAGHDDIHETDLASAITDKLTNEMETVEDPDESLVSEESDRERELSPIESVHSAEEDIEPEQQPEPTLEPTPEQPPETPRRGWGISSLIPSSVSRLLPFGRNTPATPQDIATPDHRNERQQQHAATEPSRPHISATQGTSRVLPLAPPATSATLSTQDAVDSSTPTPNPFLSDTLPLSKKRTLSRTALFKTRSEEKLRNKRRYKRRDLELEIDKLQKQERLWAQYVNKMDLEWLKVKNGGTRDNPHNMRQGRLAENRRQEQISYEENRQREKDEFAEECRQKAEEYKVKMMEEITGVKRRRQSPESIPNPPGCSYGMYDEYFDISSDEDEPTPPPAKKARLTPADYGKLMPANFGGSQEEYEVWRKAIQAAEAAHKASLAADSPSKTPLQPTRFGSSNASPTPSESPSKSYEVSASPRINVFEDEERARLRLQKYFEEEDAKAARRLRSPSKVVEEPNLSTIEEQSEGSTYIEPERYNWPEGYVHQNTFTVPDDSYEDDEEYDPKDSYLTPAKKTPAGSAGIGSTTPKPSGPFGSTAQSTDSQKGPSGAELSYIKQRDQALKYAPKTPSRLQQSSRLSSSTVASDDQTPRANQESQNDYGADDFSIKGRATQSAQDPSQRKFVSTEVPPGYQWTPFGPIPDPSYHRRVAFEAQASTSSDTSEPSFQDSTTADPATQSTTTLPSSNFGQSFDSNVGSTFPTSFGSTFGSSQPQDHPVQSQPETSSSSEKTFELSSSFVPFNFNPYADNRDDMTPRAQAFMDSHWGPHDDDTALKNFQEEFEAFQAQAIKRDNASLPAPASPLGSASELLRQLLPRPAEGESFRYPESLGMTDKGRTYLEAMWGPADEENAAASVAREFDDYLAVV